jgi:hypothetical protein
MDEELASHKAHIQSLKRELSAACRRQMSDDGMSDPGNYGASVSTIDLSALRFIAHKQQLQIEIGVHVFMHLLFY